MKFGPVHIYVCGLMKLLSCLMGPAVPFGHHALWLAKWQFYLHLYLWRTFIMNPLRTEHFLEHLANSSSITTELSTVRTYLLTYLLTSWSRIILEKLIFSQLVKKFPAFYGTRRSITAFTRPSHVSLSWTRSIQSMPHHIPLSEDPP